MERKRTGRLLAAFAVALVAALGLVLGAGARAYATSGVRWSEDQEFDANTEIEAPVIVEKDITVTIAEGKTLTVNEGIYAAGCTLTFKGSGIVLIHGENGRDGASGESQGDNGRNGYFGILGDVIVDGPTVTCVGGSGGQGGGADKAQDSVGGNGGNGAPAIDGSLTVLGGKAELIGGNGGKYGEGKYNGGYGADSKAISGTVTADVIKASSDGERYDTLHSPANTEARFVNATTEVEPDPDPEPAEAQDMYRLYNPYSGEHFYTSSKDERNQLASIGWNYEGVGWKAPVESEVPVYRLYNPYGGDHHYTVSEFELGLLVELGWTDEGIGWYSAGENGVPLYRQYNPYADTGTHNYTTSEEEAMGLVRLGWRAEGIGWYGL